ncbi:unnamed protein product [Chilo suppressalis]|uniref:Dystroglycan 1 n=1 Tax=Chilo suppressalis TaxID=168631 RepID=A0ABN8AY49_CHISP|nr:unnamed protein product [Chilo suppressalis]
MGRTQYIACALLLLCPLALSRHDDDFAFDNSDEFQLELTANHSEIARNGLKRLWGVPDTPAYVGHLFRMEIPKEAFTGEVLAYKVRREDGRRMPSWLAVDSKHGLISGIPQHGDLGPHTFTVTAHGRTHGLTATDSFTIEVKKAEEKPHSKYGTCIGNEKRLILIILIDGAFQHIPSRQRIRALMELANFMAIDGEEFWIAPYKSDSEQAQSVLMAGPGNSQRRRGDATTAIYLNVGCGEKMWSRHKVLVAGIREQARDGTLAHLLRLPVLGWRLAAARAPPRHKRQSDMDEGSGLDDIYDDEGDADDGEDDFSGDGYDDDYGEVAPSPHPHRHHHGDPIATHTTDTFQAATDTEPTPKPTTTPPTTQTKPTTTQTKPMPTQTKPMPTQTKPIPTQTSPVPTQTQPTTTTQLTTLKTTTEEHTTTTEGTSPEPASTNTYTTKEPEVKIDPISEPVSESSNVSYTLKLPINPRLYPIDKTEIIPEETPTTPEVDMQTVIIRETYNLPTSSAASVPMTSSEIPTSPIPESTPISSTPVSPVSIQAAIPPVVLLSPINTTTAVPTTTTEQSTTLVAASTTQEVPTTSQEPAPSSEKSSTIIGRTTETVTFPAPVTIPLPVNQPPTLKHHMKKLAITAGKAFRYIIPADLFTDPEEGSNLTFTMYLADNVRLSKTSWIQFIPSGREVYGLPLEAHVSRWNFIVEAQDSEGLVARGPLDITIQQHKSVRTINHKFVMEFKLIRDYNNTIDWQIKALEGLVNLFRDTDMDHLTVLNATQNGDICQFVWTNDTLPKDPACPKDDIKRLMKIMESDTEPGSPSAGLARAMSPELKVSSVSWEGVGACSNSAGPVTHAPDTYPPVTRNQVDHLTATAGHLFIYKVPEDTFFDPEDGGTRNLHLSVRYDDRSELPAGHWLQFDANNQEFYGLPAPGDEGSVPYQLIAEDSSKKSAYDSIVVEVLKAPSIRPTVEFQMTMEYPFPMLAYDATNKRKVVEKLAALFGQKATDNIRIDKITDNPTTIIWYNTSLPMDRCPKKEIEELRKMIIVDYRGSAAALKENVDHVFDKDLKVMSIRLIPQGLCAEQNTKIPKTTIQVHPGSNPVNQHSSKTASANDNGYLITFVIPAVVIVCMILVAGIIACVLYRRRRTGKMSVGDEEERQAFRSKGIPVIFQDELEERADTEPVHKSPVIMREEKPPLLPTAPDYRHADDAPYRPPPPFASTRTPPRPKATPTYRKPPPYVPP